MTSLAHTSDLTTTAPATAHGAASATAPALHTALHKTNIPPLILGTRAHVGLCWTLSMPVLTLGAAEGVREFCPLFPAFTELVSAIV